MTLPLFVLAAVCAVNAPRCRTAVRHWRLAGLGAGLTFVVLLPLAVLADPLLDAVGISAATARLATGLLLLATGLLIFGWPRPEPEPALPRCPRWSPCPRGAAPGPGCSTGWPVSCPACWSWPASAS